MRRVRRDRAGFGMFVVVMLMAVVSVVGLSLMDVIRVDLLIVGNEAEQGRAREMAEGALMEIITDEDLPDRLPGLADPNLSAPYSPTTNSQFSEARAYSEVEATARLLRIVPLMESSHTYSRAVVHEVSVNGEVAGGAATHDVSATIYQTITFRPGIVLPRRHAR